METAGLLGNITGDAMSQTFDTTFFLKRASLQEEVKMSDHY